MSDSIVEFLSFWVGDEEYAVDILEIGEIIKVPEITGGTTCSRNGS